ncbi:MAG TPA: PA2169 family four-helix-bundle protein [Gemmatirosa sp.]
MPTPDSGVIDALNSLLTGSRDGAENYRDAAESVQRADIKAALGAFAHETATQAVEFEAEIRRLGGDPESGGKLQVKVRRALQNVKSAVSGHDDSATLSEVESGLDQAERNYALALREAVGGETRALVERNWAVIARHHDQIAAWLRQDPGKSAA